MTQIKINRRPPPRGNTNQNQNRPATPGQQMNVKAVQNFSNSKPFIIGEDYAQPAGLSTAQKVNLSGQIGILVGINVYSTGAGETKFTFKINNEEVISDANAKFYTPNFNQTTKGKEYFELERPLGGSDKVTIQTNAANAGRFYCVYYVQPHV